MLTHLAGYHSLSAEYLHTVMASIKKFIVFNRISSIRKCSSSLLTFYSKPSVEMLTFISVTITKYSVFAIDTFLSAMLPFSQ